MKKHTASHHSIKRSPCITQNNADRKPPVISNQQAHTLHLEWWSDEVGFHGHGGMSQERGVLGLNSSLVVVVVPPG